MKEINCNICEERKHSKLFLLNDLYTNKDNKTEFQIVRCMGCGLVYIDPQPSYEELSPFYQSGYFDELNKKDASQKKIYLFLKKVRKS